MEEKWFMKIDSVLKEIGSVNRALALFIVSSLMLGLAGGLVFALYRGVIYVLANKPWWLKILW